jgi:replicative DNA helicase
MGTTRQPREPALAIGAITGALKGLAKELKIPILLLSQLSRDQEKRGGKPKLSDLRDSGRSSRTPTS